MVKLDKKPLEVGRIGIAKSLKVGEEFIKKKVNELHAWMLYLYYNIVC